MLKTKNLSHSFGKFRVINDVNFSISEKEIRAIIGPNGAGKTTFFNLLTGALIPQKGKIVFQDQDISKFPIHQRILLGLSRSFQIPNIFYGLDVFENMRLAVQSRIQRSVSLFKRADHMSQVLEQTLQLLSEIHLKDKKNYLVGNLSHGDKRLLEIGLAMGTEPQLLLLDEPTAGLSEEETQKLKDLIKSLSEKYTIIFIEHDIELVMNLADKITVLHQGSIIAEGAPEEIKNNAEVQSIYLGRGE